MNFRLLALFVCLWPRAASADDVPWLKDVQAPETAANVPVWKPLTPLLQDAAGTPIASLDAWKARRDTLRSEWRTFLGPMPKRPADLEIKSISKETFDWGTRELVEYTGEPGLRERAYILRPAGDAKPGTRAGIVALHPTTALTIDAIAGVQGEDRQHTGLKLARAGFVVVCPMNFLWKDAKTLNAAVEKFQARHPDAKGMAKMLYDAERGVDLLLAQPDVDAKRVAAFGHSLGAKEVLYLLAFDDRVHAGVASEGGIALDSTNWDAAWYLGPMAKDSKWSRNHHELLALIAPRPFLVIGGEQGPGAADGTRSLPYLRAAEPVYALYGSSARLGLLNHGMGHPLTPDAFAKGIEWLRTYTE